MSEVANSIKAIIDTGAIANRWSNGREDETIDTAGGPIKTLAGLNKSMSAAVFASLSATSNTRIVAEKGAKTFITQPGKTFQRGQYLAIASADIALGGTVSAYLGDTLVMDIDYVKGSGVASSWQISLSGPSGATNSAAAPATRLVRKLPWEL